MGKRAKKPKRVFPANYRASLPRQVTGADKFVLREYIRRMQSYANGESVPPTRGLDSLISTAEKAGTTDATSPRVLSELLRRLWNRNEADPEFVEFNHVVVYPGRKTVVRFYFGCGVYFFIRQDVTTGDLMRSIVYASRDQAMRFFNLGWERKIVWVQYMQQSKTPS